MSHGTAPTPDAGPAADVHAVDALEAYDDDRQAKFWKMRKAGLPILLSRTGDEKHWPFVEDTAVPPEHLPEYVSDLQELFDSHDTFAAYYAHAGPGVLHVRPLLNLKEASGIEAMEGISDAVTDRVIEYGGSVSGEHGDGRAHTRYTRKLYGDGLWETFRELKRAFDSAWLLNPGNICGDHDPTEDLRFDPDYAFESGFTPVLNRDNDKRFQGMVELCHGCAGCTGHQETTGGVMCPTYRASEEEITSTRGRANALQQAMSGDLPAFHRRTFRDRVDARGGPAVPEAEADRKALLIADPYTNYSHPDVGEAALDVLEAAGVHVRVPDDVTDSGRPAFSKSMLDRARSTAVDNVAALAPRVRDGWDVVTVEPSGAVMYQLDYLDLLSGPDAEAVADNAYGICEYLDVYELGSDVDFDAPGRSLSYHGHCHQKATRKDHHAVGVLRRAGYDVDPIDSGCCGMAGSFGYEAEHRSMSGAIASILFDQLDDSPAAQPVAPGASCRSQLDGYDGCDGEPPHPIEMLADALRRSPSLLPPCPRRRHSPASSDTSVSRP